MTFVAAVERIAQVAGGACMALTAATPFGQMAQGVVLSGVATTALVAAWAEAKRKCPGECELHLSGVIKAAQERLLAGNPDYAIEYADAARLLSEHLLDYFPSAEQLGRAAVSDKGFTVAATEAILADLRAKGLGFDRNEVYNRFARDVIETTLECAWADRQKFPEIARAAFMEAFAAIGRLERATGRIESKQDQLVTLVQSRADDVLAKLDELTLGDRLRLSQAEEQISRIRAEGTIRDSAIAAFLESVGETALSPEQLPGQLAAFASRYTALVEELKVTTSASAAQIDERDKARSALESGDILGAERVLADLEVRQQLQSTRQEATLRESTRDLATTRIARAELSLMKFDHLRAAELFAEAADTFPKEDRLDRWRTRMKQAFVLAERGKLFFDSDSLHAAVDTCRSALALTSIEDSPLEWAATQNRFGTALAMLAVHGDAGVAHEAVKAHRQALEVFDRNGTPDEWADTYNRLGVALLRSGGADALSEAVAAHRLSLDVYTLEDAPFDWAGTQNNIGNALAQLGERGDADALVEAISAFRSALKVMTCEVAPEDWAKTQNNLGLTLARLGELGDERASRESVVAFRAALEVVDAASTPSLWVTLHKNLGSSLRKLGDATALRAAVTAYEAAIAGLDRQIAPVPWADLQDSLAGVLHRLGELGDNESMNSAISHYWLALGELKRDQTPTRWAATQNNLGVALRMASESGDRSALDLAIGAFRTALEAIDPYAEGAQFAATTDNLGSALERRAESTGNREDLELAAESLRAALNTWPLEEAALRDATSTRLAAVLAKLDLA